MNRRLQALLPIGAALLLAGFAAAFAWTCDDAFIAFRIGRNFVEGHGLGFNPDVSPQVEGHTATIWQLLLVLLEALRLEIVSSARALEGAIAALLVWWFTRACLRGPLALGPAGAVAAALVLATAPPLVVWATGGLGTPTIALAVFVAVERLLVAGRGGSVAVAVLAVALLPYVRFDGPVFVAAITVTGFVAGRSTGNARLVRASVLGAAWALLGFVAQTGMRLAYYGDWLPNTARAKGGIGAVSLERGIDYLLSGWLAFPLLAVVLLPAALAALRERRRDPTPLLVGGVLFGAAGYVVLVGGDFMAMGRFFVPALPFVAWTFGRLVQRLAARRASPLLPAATTAVALVLSVPALFDVSLLPRGWREAVAFRHNGPFVSEREFYDGMSLRARRWSCVGKALARIAKPGDSIVLGAIGAVGYYSGVTVHDRHGLVDRQVAIEVPLTPDAIGLPGHDHVAPLDFFDARRPTWTQFELLLGAEATPEARAAIEPLRLAGVVDVVEVTPADGAPEDGLLVLLRFVPPELRPDAAPRKRD
ncbi:MAG: hypothetical protein R3F29_00090 [Planctomycetota bacterium]